MSDSPAPRDRIAALISRRLGVNSSKNTIVYAPVNYMPVADALIAAFPVLAAEPTTEEHGDAARAAAYAAYKERIGWSSVNDAGNVDFDEGWWARDRAALAPEPAETDSYDEQQNRIEIAAYPIIEARLGVLSDLAHGAFNPSTEADDLIDLLRSAGFVLAAPLAALAPEPAETNGNEWFAAINVERERQREKGFTSEHDREHGVDHLLMWAQEYARRGKPVKSAALIEAARELLLSHPPAVSPDEPKGD